MKAYWAPYLNSAVLLSELQGLKCGMTHVTSPQLMVQDSWQLDHARWCEGHATPKQLEVPLLSRKLTLENSSLIDVKFKKHWLQSEPLSLGRNRFPVEARFLFSTKKKKFQKEQQQQQRSHRLAGW